MGLFKPKLRKDIQQKLDEWKPLTFITVPITAGLPLQEGTSCQLYYCQEKIIIDGNNDSFIIPINKIHDITRKTDVEIQKQIVSSTGGAIAGAIMFGAVGALIGGRAKTKTSREIIIYLIFTFESKNGDIQNIAFDVTHTPKSEDFVKLFSKHTHKSKITNL